MIETRRSTIIMLLGLVFAVGCKSTDKSSSSVENDSDSGADAETGGSSSGGSSSSVAGSGGSAGTGTSGGSGGTETNAAGSGGSGGTETNATGSGETSSVSGGASAGGSSGSSGGSGGGGEPISSCADLGSRVCAGLHDCGGFLVEANYDSIGQCEETYSEICEALGGEEGMDFARCAQALSTCDVINEEVGAPSWCWSSKGSAGLGDSCLKETDCADGRCERAKGEETGTCRTPARESDPCPAPTRCEMGLRCTADYSCVRPVADGEACSGAFECRVGSICLDGTCSKTQVGDPCVSAALPCDGASGQFCLLDACTAINWVEGDESCSSSSRACEGASRCVVEQISGFEQIVECRNTVGLGAACNDQSPCLVPLSCREGTCQP